jgi:predicted MPP superfamily phosphohydrolase
LFWVIAAVFALLLLIVWCVFETSILKIRRENIKCKKNGASPLKIVHLSDLHSHRFGKSNTRLAKKILKLAPDIIFCTGDFLDRFTYNATPFFELSAQIKGLAPIYFSLGNHEVRVLKKQPKAYFEFKEHLKSLGIVILDNQSESVCLNGSVLKIFGFTPPRSPLGAAVLPSEFDLNGALGRPSATSFNILLAHEPMAFSAYAAWGADLTLAGHIHGGLARLPFIGAVFGDGGKLFPKYSKGLYFKNNTVMNVSAGLGYTKLKLRFCNIPEIVVLNIT